MKNRCRIILAALLAAQFCFCSCVSLRGNVPYFASGELVFQQEGLVLEYDFLNKNSKTVEKVDFVVCAVDSGDDDFSARRYFVSCKVCVPPGESVEDYLELHDFFDLYDNDDFNGSDLQIESFYAEKIYYSDGTFFEDPFGRFSG